MIILHALWTPGTGLRVWGEHATVDPPRRRCDHPRLHPFACPAEELHAALGGESAYPEPIAVLLPSSSGSPAPSLELARLTDREPERAVRLLPWTVPACLLDRHAGAELLLDLASAMGARVAAGRTLRYLAQVARFALDLTMRGHILPSLERRGDGFFACWRAAFTDPRDVARLSLLERCMPPACRSGVEWLNAPRTSESEPRQVAPQPTALTVLTSALAVLTDACARAALPTLPLPSPQQRSPGRRLGNSWLRALAGPDGQISGDVEEIAELQGRLERWGRVAESDPRSLYRTCFRLSAPGADAQVEAGENVQSPVPARRAQADGPTWRLEFALQRTDDPSLLIPADDIWAGNGGSTPLHRRGDTPQEWLLEDLGRARRLYPEIDSALQSARPSGLDLRTEQAYAFLRDAVPLMMQAGFGVHLPPWWKESDCRLGLKLRIRAPEERSTSSGILGLSELCAYDWRLSLGDERLSASEFEAIASCKLPLVRLRGQWLVLRSEEVEAVAHLFQSAEARGTITALQALRIAFGAALPATDLPVVGIEAQPGADDGLLALLSGDDRIEPIDTPADFRGKLRPYQERGLAWLSFLDRNGIGACLADDMGLGKTIQLLALLLARETGTDATAAHTPTLLICPMSVVGNWQHEAAKFAPTLRVLVHHGSDRLAGEAFGDALRHADLVITTYGLAARDRETLAAVGWRRVVLDEAQNIKNSSARQTRAIRSLPTRRRIALTGTPVENRLSELWSIMDFLNPGLLGSTRDFRDRFATPIERHGDAEQSERLRRLTRPFILRRVKTDRSIIGDLPEKQEMKVYCNLTREQASLYQAVVDDMLARVDESEGIERRGLILSTMTKLKQVCNHPAQLLRDRSELSDRSGKLALLEDILGEALDVGDRSLVFTQFAEMGSMLREHLERHLGCEILYLRGQTRRKLRDEMVARFQATGGPPVFILSLKAGGTGLNLTAANQVIHFDRWWNPAVENQATDRAFRIGQNRKVQVRKIICTGTLEERIDLMIERKKDLAERIIGAGEGWLTELSTAELREIVGLSGDAVSE